MIIEKFGNTFFIPEGLNEIKDFGFINAVDQEPVDDDLLAENRGLFKLLKNTEEALEQAQKRGDSYREKIAERDQEINRLKAKPPRRGNGGWEPGEHDDLEPEPRQFPELGEAALPGLAGEIAKACTIDSEVDPAAVLFSFLTWFGTAAGNGPRVQIGDTAHCGRLFSVLVGSTSRARKGTSRGPVQRVMNAAQGLGLSLPGPILPPLKPVSQTDGPLSSGEGLIYSVRDAQENAKGEIEDPGVVDKRLLVLEGEFGAALRCMGRPGNTLSTTLRTAWDAANGWNVLAPITKSSRIAATNPHIGILGHITRAELTSLLSSVDLYSGLANRLLWICVRRQKPVALPPPLNDQMVGELGRRVAERLKAAQEAAGVFRFTREAEQAWLALYDELTIDKPGAYGAATSRAEAQTVRLALIYALLDGAADINVQHIQAARAAWDYCDQSARYIFGDRESDPNADRLIEALRQGPMTKTKISGLFSNNLSARQLTELLEALQEAGRINLISKSTAGRPTTEIHLVS